MALHDVCLYPLNEPKQNEDGGWGLHIVGESCMLCTVLNYIQLRILGEEADKEACFRARKWILDHGTALYIPSWGKIWLAVSIIILIFLPLTIKEKYIFINVFIGPFYFIIIVQNVKFCFNLVLSGVSYYNAPQI